MSELCYSVVYHQLPTCVWHVDDTNTASFIGWYTTMKHGLILNPLMNLYEMYEHIPYILVSKRQQFGCAVMLSGQARLYLE